VAIEFRCTCGKMLSVPDDAAGRRAKCPSCGALANVPGAAPPEPPEESEGLTGSFIDAPRPLVILAGVLAGSAFLVLILTLIAAAKNEWITWFFVWLPQAVLGGLGAFWIIQDNPLGKKVLSLAAPGVIGVNYAMFWLSIAAVAFGGTRGLLVMFSALIQMGVYGFLYWHYRHGGGSGQSGAPEADVIDEDASSPQ